MARGGMGAGRAGVDLAAPRAGADIAQPPRASRTLRPPGLEEAALGARQTTRVLGWRPAPSRACRGDRPTKHRYLWRPRGPAATRSSASSSPHLFVEPCVLTLANAETLLAFRSRRKCQSGNSSRVRSHAMERRAIHDVDTSERYRRSMSVRR